ncbi:MAG: hypothetical protein D3922_06535 [Candidatus Electrothrix sp. AR1]|nr:hypothetical protein [Candidatus Electrothrix sp. AR1]
MFCKNILKSIACIILITYCSTLGVDLAWANDQDIFEIPLLAQVFTNRTPEEETKQRKRKIYKNKAQRLENEISKMEGSQELLLDVVVTSAFVGLGLFAGANNIEETINDIELAPGNTRGEKDKENALDALQSVEQVGWGAAGISVLSAIGGITYLAVTGHKQKKKEELLEASNNLLLDKRNSSPNEALKAIEREIEELKKAQNSNTSFQHAFSSIAIGSLITGGLLWGMSGPLRDNLRDIEIHDNDIVEQQYRREALEAADGMENRGKGLVITGAVSGVASFFAWWLADDKEEEIDELEKGLLRANHHIDITPQPDGFVFLYSYNF